MWENIKSQECDKGCLGQTFGHISCSSRLAYNMLIGYLAPQSPEAMTINVTFYIVFFDIIFDQIIVTSQKVL